MLLSLALIFLCGLLMASIFEKAAAPSFGHDPDWYFIGTVGVKLAGWFGIVHFRRFEANCPHYYFNPSGIIPEYQGFEKGWAASGADVFCASLF